jgi:hypothetical protein
MTAKKWTPSEIRTIAKETVDGRHVVTSARGAYFRALIETAQADLGGKADQAAQLQAVKAVHKRFYPIVQEATTTDDTKDTPKLDRAERRRRSLERNRRQNFARSAYTTIHRWLRAPDHDLMRLNSATVTKSQLLKDAPPTRKHALTAERVQKKAENLTGALVGFARQVAKVDGAQAAAVLKDAIAALQGQLGAYSGVRKSRQQTGGHAFERRAA